MPPPERADFRNVQVLRALAALLVVAHHAYDRTNVAADYAGHFLVGQSGVDIFFPISGFVMVVSTRAHWGGAGAWRDFLRKRFVRIVPLYWSFTALKVATIVLFPQQSGNSRLDPYHIVASFLFVPARHPVFASAQPVLVVGWTLNFEMAFYLLFAAALALSARPVAVVAAALLAMAGADWFRTAGWPPVATLLDPVVLEFVFGMAIALAVLHGRHLPGRLALPVAVLALACLLAGGYALPREMISETGSYSSGWRAVFWGVPGAALLFAAVSLEGARITRLPLLLLLPVGDASYAIYLSHGFVLQAVRLVWTRLGWSHAAGFGSSILVGVALSLAVGVAVHRCFEAPLLRLIRRGPRRAGRLALRPSGP